MTHPFIKEVRGIKDPIKQGIADGWQTQNADKLANDTIIETDIAIIGTGAGGGTSAEILTKAGLKVLLIEEGPLKSSDSFRMDEREAYRDLYQENAGRMSKDGAISILQGRCVGGSTVVNWTSSFRTPEPTLNHWQQEFDVKDSSPEEMAPWFAQMEQRLNISPWIVPPNENNSVLSRGSEALGISWKVIPRNVAGCWNLGYCGTGCPTNAKQSMLVTTIPSALEKGASLLYQARAERLALDGDKVAGIELTALDTNKKPNGNKIIVKAKQVIMACGGINGPALLLRSQVPDPQELVGKRTFLHPVPFIFAQFDEKIDPYYGAPQSIYSDHFQWESVDGQMGYKLEVPPMQPGLTSVLMSGHGEDMVESMSQLPNTHSMLALLRDGFNEESQGASIELADDGSPIINYPLNDYLWDGVKRAHLSMAEIQFAAGAKRVRPAHTESEWYSSWPQAKAAIEQTEFKQSATLLGCAHVMGGLPIGENKEKCLVDSQGKYHYLDNLYVMDGSLFPTSIGANPQLSVYGIACRLATGLAQKLTKEKA